MPRKTITIGIADDRKLDTGLIEYHIKAIKNTQILFRSANGFDLLQKLKIFKPNIIILDIYMPLMTGWEVIHQLDKINYAGKIICTTRGYENNLIARLKDLGVHGFSRKHTNHMTKAVIEVSEGRTYYDEEFALYKDNLFRNLPQDEVENCSENEVEISGREIEIINKLSEGKNSTAIAEELGTLTSATIDTYIKNILDKLDLKNRTHLVAYGFAYGLIYTFDGYKNLPNQTEIETL